MATSRFKTCQFPPKFTDLLRKRNIKDKGTKEKVYQIFPALKKKEKRYLKRSSGGEQQMLVICRSLMSNPQLSTVNSRRDFIGLAPIIVEKVLDTIRTINEESATVLLVEQNVHDSLNAADMGYAIEE
ncbi:MAG: hypothetical protein ABR909_09025 [Candidatus Bathyarchaeia archaeon]|jgi:branched-chain amino acid transport system ATP-binding protein